MAVLTIGSAVAPVSLPWAIEGVNYKIFSGAGVDSTEVAAALTGYYHVVIGGRVSASGAETFTILSAANVLDTIRFIAASTANIAPGIQTVVSEALNIKITTGATMQGWIAYKTMNTASAESTKRITTL